MLRCSTAAGQSQQRWQCMWVPLGGTRGMLSSNLTHPRGAPALANGHLGDLALPMLSPSPSCQRKAAGRSLPCSPQHTCPAGAQPRSPLLSEAPNSLQGSKDSRRLRAVTPRHGAGGEAAVGGGRSHPSLRGSHGVGFFGEVPLQTCWGAV